MAPVPVRRADLRPHHPARGGVCNPLFFLFLKIHHTLGLTVIVIGHTVWNSAHPAIIVQARMAGLDPEMRG